MAATSLVNSTSTLSFPSQEILVTCFDKHHLSGKQALPFLSEKGVTQAVAESLANTKKNLTEVEASVQWTLSKLNQRLGLADPALSVTYLSLMRAIKDCANLRFPPQEELISCFSNQVGEQSFRFYSEKGLLEAITQMIVGKDLAPEVVDDVISIVLYERKDELQLNTLSFLSLHT